jgi:hypothetical protein
MLRINVSSRYQNEFGVNDREHRAQAGENHHSAAMIYPELLVSTRQLFYAQFDAMLRCHPQRSD